MNQEESEYMCVGQVGHYARVDDTSNNDNFANFLYVKEYKQPDIAMKATSSTPNGALTKDMYLEILKKREEARLYKLSLDEPKEEEKGGEEETSQRVFRGRRLRR